MLTMLIYNVCFFGKLWLLFYMHDHAEEQPLAEVCHRAKIKATNKQTLNHRTYKVIESLKHAIYNVFFSYSNNTPLILILVVPVVEPDNWTEDPRNRKW